MIQDESSINLSYKVWGLKSLSTAELVISRLQDKFWQSALFHGVGNSRLERSQLHLGLIFHSLTQTCPFGRGWQVGFSFPIYHLCGQGYSRE